MLCRHMLSMQCKYLKKDTVNSKMELAEIGRALLKI